VPRTSTRCAQKLPWVTKELNGLKNKMTKAAKKMKESERRCMADDDISEFDCERLRTILLLLEVRIRSVMGLLMTLIELALQRRSRKNVLVIHMSIRLNFEGQSGPGSQEICERTMGAIGSRA
jgi:hypothetical protein